MTAVSLFLKYVLTALAGTLLGDENVIPTQDARLLHLSSAAASVSVAGATASLPAGRAPCL